MFANHAVYKGYRLSAHVHRSAEGENGGAPGFYATIAIVAIGQAPEPDNGSVLSHRGANPRDAIEAAVAHGRSMVDALSTFTKTRRPAALAR